MANRSSKSNDRVCSFLEPVVSLVCYIEHRRRKMGDRLEPGRSPVKNSHPTRHSHRVASKLIRRSINSFSTNALAARRLYFQQTPHRFRREKLPHSKLRQQCLTLQSRVNRRISDTLRYKRVSLAPAARDTRSTSNNRARRCLVINVLCSSTRRDKVINYEPSLTTE